MSNRMTPSAAGSISGVQPVAASRASVSRSTISSSRPTCSRTRAQEFGAVRGRAAGLGRDQPRARHAAVAHLVAADAQRLDGAPDRGLAQAAGRCDALAEPDDARERVDDAEAVARRRAPPAAGNCWCRDRARHRSGRTDPSVRPAADAGADADRATADPAGAAARRPIGHGVEAGRPGLVVHRKPFCRAEACQARRPRRLILKRRCKSNQRRDAQR